MKFICFQRQTIWWPTRFGWVCILLPPTLLVAFWFFYGESFLAVTDRKQAEVLVVEGWIGTLGVRSAKTEFESGDYKYVVTTGGRTGEDWDEGRWNYAVEAGEILLRMGVPNDKLIIAPAPDTGNRRTYESAVAARDAMLSRGIVPKSMNVFSRGPHSRRSRLVYSKVFGSGVAVGALAWWPLGETRGSWRESSSRSKEFLDETAAYFFEAFLGSGRFLQSAGAGPTVTGVATNNSASAR